MTGNKTDAATSTDDIKGRPLCLFYFTHPFGVLSPDPPTVTHAPVDIAQAFVNMQPVPYNLWSQSSSDHYNTSSSSSAKPKVSYELGSISRKPLNIISYGERNANLGYPGIDCLRRESISSSLFSSDLTEPLWSFPSSSSKNEKRLPLPYILPPLEMPLRDLECSEDVQPFWEVKRPMHKLSLPPIELPARRVKDRSVVKEAGEIGVRVCEEVECRGVRRRTVSRIGVRKTRRVRKSGLRRMVTHLIQRATRGREREPRASPAAIQELLTTIREAWPEPGSLQDRSRTATSDSSTPAAAAILNPAAMLPRQQLTDALTPRPGASPGLMRRRYSVPETIMRKYRLAQLRSDSDDSEPATAPSREASPASPASLARGSCASLCEPPAHRFLRRDRELMRKSTLLRRLWGGRQTASNNELTPCSCTCDSRYCSDRELYDSHTEYGRESRSLDGSRAELGNASGFSRSSRSRESQPPLAGWATPKRQRLDSASGLNGSDEMLRTAMRNSYDRAAEQRHEREKREEPTSSDSTFQSHGREESSGDVSRLTEAEAESAEKPRKKRRQSVSIFMNSLDSPSAEIKSETVTNTPETADSYTMPRTEEQTATSNSTFVTSDISSTNACSETTNTVCSGSASTNGIHYRDSLDGQTEESSDNSKSEYYNQCLIKSEDNSGNYAPVRKGDVRIIEPSPKDADSTVEILEIFVSETLNSSAFESHKIMPAIDNSKNMIKVLDNNKESPKKHQMDLDQYVSNILVESLNSLTDQIEEMNASMGGDRKISIVEKEIKVKLQNTGMNTIVHLSPNSNNPIIFGNEELYDKQEISNKKNIETCNEDDDNMSADTIKLELTDNNELRLTDSSDNIAHVNANEFQTDNESSSMMMVMSNENINKAVLQQIQKLFQDGLQQFDPKMNYPGRMVPEISHIEISNVDVFIDDNSDPNYESNDRIEISTDRNSCSFECSLQDGNMSIRDSVLGEVGAGTYFKEPVGPVLVPRFSAFPNTDSMEVNTSSSDDGEVIGSDSTSLVDSLDDPNSPRNILRRVYSSRRNELVRSAIDVLDLLPETAQDSDFRSHADKSEAFFIRIKDNECDCEKENIVVADHMPDKIKQRLYRRHRKRELRMEYAKRKKVRQIKREIENQRQPEIIGTKKEIEKDCSLILESLIDEVIAKIAEQEHKYMRIKQKKSSSNNKSEDSLSSNGNKKPKGLRKTSAMSDLESLKANKGDAHSYNNGNVEKEQKTKTYSNDHDFYRTNAKSHIRGKLALQPHTPLTPDGYVPKRIYQKSEIHDGNKCVEILEILEYVESSQSSPDTTNSDENHNENSKKNRKSRIPIPVYERIHRLPRIKNIQNPYKNALLVRSSPNLKFEKLTNYRMDDLISDMFIDAINDNGTDRDVLSKDSLKAQQAPARRASVPQQDAHRSRSTTRFKQMFDIIPEEKSSLSVESSNEDINLNRRVSAPVLTNKYSESNNNHDSKNHDNIKAKGDGFISKTSRLSKSTSTSPPLADDFKIKMQNVSTSPLRQTISAATSPVVPLKISENGHDLDKNNSVKPVGNAKKSLSSHGTREGWVGFYKPKKHMMEEEGLQKDLDMQAMIGTKKRDEPKSTSTQYDNPQTQSTVSTIETEKCKQIIINHDKMKQSSEKSKSRDASKSRTDDARKQNSNNKESKRRRDRHYLEKHKEKDLKSKRDSRMVHSQSDPQTRTDYVIKKTDTKKIQMFSVEKNEEDSIHSKSLRLPDSYKDKQADQSGDTSSDSDSDSAKSLLCSLAPKWLSIGSGARQKRQVRKKASQEPQSYQNTAGGWSVTVAGNCYTALPADVEMRLSFPKSTARQVTSQSDSGFGEDIRSRRSIAAAQKPRESSCKCRHCDGCTCSRVRSLEQDSSCSPFLPPAHNRKMTLMMKKESTGSSILASKNLKKQNESLPEVESYKASKNKSKNSIKSRRLSLHCWLPGDDHPAHDQQHPRASEALAVLGCAIIPESKPRVPTMSERDLTRVYTPRHYLRS